MFLYGFERSWWVSESRKALNIYKVSIFISLIYEQFVRFFVCILTMHKSGYHLPFLSCCHRHAHITVIRTATIIVDSVEIKTNLVTTPEICPSNTDSNVIFIYNCYTIRFISFYKIQSADVLLTILIIWLMKDVFFLQ